jgi:hypothetical protein
VRFEETQKIIIGSSGLGRMIAMLFTALISIIAWIGLSLINRIETLATNLNTYEIRMENRVTALEQVRRDK